MKKLFLLILMLLAFDFGFGQSIFSNDINGTGTNQPANFNPFTNGQIVDTNISVSGIGRGIGIEDNGANNRYNARGWNTPSTDLSAYFEFTISPNTGYEIDFSSFEYNGQASGTGPSNFAFRSSLDGYAANIGSPNTGGTTIPLTSSSYQNITTSITFRFYGWGASGGGGTFSINDFVFNGIVTPISPCPTIVTYNSGTGWTGTPTINTEVIITSNYNTSAGSFSACSLTVNAGAILTIDNGTYIEVENDVLVNDGEIRVETGGNFVQNDDAGTFTLNPPATAVLNKVTPVKNAWYFYTYWSSPVVNETIGNVFPDVDGDRRFYFDASEFVDTNGDDVDDNANDWQPALSSDTMVPGVGYAITAARLHPSGATDSATFEGHFNTGDITVGIAVNPANTGVNWNFIGNPYPSSIDFTAFQAANSSLISGAAYFWSQATPPSATNPGNEVLNFDLNDYAVFTIGSGGTAGGVSTEIPTGYVASAQGFFTPALTTGTATFTNSMRMADITSNNQFFKGSASKNLNNTQDNKLWINLTSGNGIFNQVLISYVDGATDGNDGMYYDAPKIVSGNFAAALYTLINNDEAMYAIQGKSNTSINQNEIINLGFNTNVEVPTIFNLSVAQLQGDFLNNNTVYLKDNLLNITHNLSDGDYNFTSETGAFTDRFEVVFKEENTLTVDDIINNESAFQIIQLDSDRVTFKTGTSATLKSIAIYDLFGRKVYQFKGENSSETFNIPNIKTGIYLAKAELSTGVIITKKAIKR